jgi:hypothetical protein
LSDCQDATPTNQKNSLERFLSTSCIFYLINTVIQSASKVLRKKMNEKEPPVKICSGGPFKV